jgi:hypothetical protein
MGEFFEPPPKPPVPEEEPEHMQPPWHAPPENRIGGGVGLEIVLFRTEDIAVTAERFLAYPTGVAFKLVRRFRTAEISWGLDPDSGFHFRGRGPRTEEEAARRLRFGVRFPDGSKATDMSPWWHHDKPPSPPVIVQSGGGGGGGRYWSEGWWLWPLPAAGVFEFAIQWPAAGVALTFKEVDARPFREAAERSIELWPHEGKGGGINMGHSFGESFRVIPHAERDEDEESD